MSTVKIRTGSLFRTFPTRKGAARAVVGPAGTLFPTASTVHAVTSQDVHSPPAFPACANRTPGCKVKKEQFWRRLSRRNRVGTAALGCPVERSSTLVHRESRDSDTA